MASITSWTRIEPRARNEEMGTALQARVWDPLWLLARQWQVGELTAEDAGSPIMVRADADCVRLSRFLAGPVLGGDVDKTRARAFDSLAQPLEALVERERLHENPLPGGTRDYSQPRTTLRIAAEAGLHFLRLLAAKDMARYRDNYLEAFPLRAPTAAEVQQLDADTLRWLTVVSRRVVDGTLLYGSLAPLYDAASGKLRDLPDEPRINKPHRANLIVAAEAWLKWYDALFSELAPGDQLSWSAQRMEYQFGVAAPSPAVAGSPSEIVLEASEYVDGRLDWYAFTTRPNAALGAARVTAPANPVSITRTVIPTPVRYRGMPSNGWFEMEDAQVNLGAIDAAPEDLARMLVVDFALLFSDDWFVIPVDLDVGSLCRVRSLVVTDTFGGATVVPHCTAIDAQPSGWRMFSIASSGQLAAASAATDDIFFLPPTLAGVLESRPAEEVLLLRDEIANVAWAVERVIESAVGRPLDRFQLVQERRRREQDSPALGAPAPLAPLVYRLMRTVPENWIPFLPQRVDLGGGRTSVRLLRARMLEIGPSSTTPAPRGRILEPNDALSLFEETVPRNGARVTRTYQLCRWIDGSMHLWSGRRTDAGYGEGSSGLRFDLVDSV